MATGDPSIAVASIDLTNVDHERGVRLSRLVGTVFGGISILILLGLATYGVIHPHSMHGHLPVVLAGLAGCVALYALGVVLARHRASLAASVIVGSAVLSIAVVQIAWMSEHDVDALTIALFGAYSAPIGLASVMGNERIMFIMTGLIDIMAAIILFSLPAHLGLAFHPASGILAWIAIVSVHWLIAVLVYASSLLYLQTAQGLGDMRAAFQRAQQLDSLKDQFISNVNHELRNPIMAFYNYVDLVRLGGATMAEERRTALLGKALQAGDRVMALLHSILDARALDQTASQFTPEVVPVRAALQAALEMIDPREGQLGERDLRISIAADLVIWGDRVRLQQILTNLISNALKYSSAGTPVEVTAQAVAEDVSPRKRWVGPHVTPTARHLVEIQVRDYGLGIPPAQISLLFQRFVRLERDLTSSVVGNGLGLYLCRLLTEAMGGRIWVESTGIAGQGAIFHVRLPTPVSGADSGMMAAVREHVPVATVVD